MKHLHYCPELNEFICLLFSLMSKMKKYVAPDSNLFVDDQKVRRVVSFILSIQ